MQTFVGVIWWDIVPIVSIIYLQLQSLWEKLHYNSYFLWGALYSLGIQTSCGSVMVEHSPRDWEAVNTSYARVMTASTLKCTVYISYECSFVKRSEFRNENHRSAYKRRSRVATGVGMLNKKLLLRHRAISIGLNVLLFLQLVTSKYFWRNVKQKQNKFKQWEVYCIGYVIWFSVVEQFVLQLHFIRFTDLSIIICSQVLD